MNQQPLGRSVAPVSILLFGLLLPLALALVAIVPGVPVQAAGNTITLATVTAAAGSTGSFGITLDNSDAVASGQVRFTYAANLGMTITGVQVTNRTTGFTSTGSAYATGNASLLGYQVLFYNLNSLTIAPSTGAILTIAYTTTANASGNTALSFTQAILANPAAQALPVTAVNGAFTITAPTATATATTIPSATPTDTATATATSTVTDTPTNTPTTTATNTPLPTATATTMPTPTPTKTATATATDTPSSLPTATATPTATSTAISPATATATATNTATATDTPSSLPTATATPTATNTAINPATATATATNTATPSSTPTSGSTATATGTPLPTATGTATPTPTNTGMSTATNTATATATNTPTATATDTATVTSTPTNTATTTATSTATSTATPTATNTPQASPTPVATLIHVSSSRNGRVDGLAYRDEDILVYGEGTNRWQIFFDGSDVGVANADLDAFTFLDDGSILMSFDKPIRFPTLGLVDDSDLVRFIPNQLGNNTIGTFEFFFDGSDVDLTQAGEDIDAVSYTRDGTLLISVYGVAEVGGVRGKDEDLLRFTPTALGADTAGSWDLYFDGSAVGLASGGEDISAAMLDAQGALILATKGNFNASSLTAIQGDSDDLFGCSLGAIGENTTACAFFAFFDGDSVRFNRPIDGVAVGTSSAVAVSGAQHDPTSDDGDQFEVLPDDPVTDDEEFDTFDELQADETPLEDMQLYLPLIGR